MSDSPKLSGDTIAYLETLAKLESLSSHEQHFDFSSYYQARLGNNNSQSYLSVPAAFFFPAAVEGIETSAKNHGRMEVEGQQEESVIRGKVCPENAENQEQSTKSTEHTSSRTQQLQNPLFPDEATCFYDHFNQGQDGKLYSIIFTS